MYAPSEYVLLREAAVAVLRRAIDALDDPRVLAGVVEAQGCPVIERIDYLDREFERLRGPVSHASGKSGALAESPINAPQGVSA